MLDSRLAVPALLLVCALPVPLRADDASGKPQYPPTRREDVVETMHGVEVPDPYHWLEHERPEGEHDVLYEEVVAWDRSQHAYLKHYMDRIPGRDALAARIERELALGGKPSLPTFRRSRRFFTHRPDGANHAVLYVTDVDRQVEPRVVLDPNAWSADGTEGLKSWTPSPDGSYVAYRRDSKGSENTTLYVRDVVTGKDLPDVITRTKFGSLVWAPDGKSFVYTRLPAPDDVPPGEEQYHRRVYWHRLGDLPLDDRLVFQQGRPRIEWPWLDTSTDQESAFLGRELEDDSVETFAFRFGADGPTFWPVITGRKDRTWIDKVGSLYLINSDADAPRRALYVAPARDVANRARWHRILPEGHGVIENAVPVGNRIVVHLREDVVSRLKVIDTSGKELGDVPLPGPGTVGEIVTRPDDHRIWFTFESMSVPDSNYVCDLDAEGMPITAEETTPTTVDVSTLESTRVTYRSKDGTEIPLFLVHRKDVPLDGKAPTVLYGYGGFRVGMLPRFSRTTGLWAELGGVYAMACLRGGDEFGEEWHVQGSREHKQNVFDDFIAAADFLVEKGWASREKLAIQGGSNGGLLVAAVANQRPDLCRAVVCSVPLTDMLRFHLFQYARAWTVEYGDPDVAEEFAWIRPYSPYHNVKQGAAYPAALVTAGAEDGRVNPFHARKIVAQWQHATSSDRPILLYLDHDSGHGSSSVKQYQAQLLDRFSFLLNELGALPAPPAVADR